jgi:hypothetical protein
MSEEDRTEQAPGLAVALRQLAAFVDAHPTLEQFPEIFGIDPVCFGHHWFGAAAAKLDTFAQEFGGEIKHTVHPNGTRYSHITFEVDGVEFQPQAYTEDYEKATGKTIDNGGVQ